MPTASFSVKPSAKVEVICANCERVRLPAGHPLAVMCDCGKTIKDDHPKDGEKEG